ncbi:hypothetical protein DY245_20310 [Streptomyces inhibens]|uniref:PE-PGRS family protein n=1 Tax=Streptomyces inhibens TaxID=2293571 RepID=A0A371Q1S5_STRIH|nr:hypothetical protein [Streptomyces inhibens]REK88629.1 hypothetical protein DY245_20310 [Streptomyces inhibens]
MPVTAALRYVRAAVFAVVCVVLSAAGHAVMSGPALPGWAFAAAAVPVFVCAGLAAGRERSLPAIAGGMLACQGGLHLFFSWAQGIAAPVQATSKAAAWADLLLCSHSGSARPTPLLSRSMHQMVRHAGWDWHSPPARRHGAHMGLGGRTADAMPTMHHMGFGMLAAHVLAGLVCAWWLHRGERAVFALLAALAAATDRSLHRLLRLFVARATVPVAPPGPLRFQRPVTAGQLHLAVVRHAVVRRGPPLSFSY